MRYLLRIFFTLFVFFPGIISAAPKDPAGTVLRSKPAVLKQDSTVLAPAKFNAEALERYSKDQAFIYDDVVAPKASWWDKFWATVWAIIRSIFGDGPTEMPHTDTRPLRYIFMGVLIVAVVFIVMKFKGIDFRLFAGRSAAVAVPYYESAEDIHTLSFDDEIALALEQKNYRLAVRLLYLQTLKYLNDQGMIHWQPEKTNEMYVNEVQDVQRKTVFKRLTRQFEYVWYGDFAIDAERYDQLSRSFKQFNARS